MGCERSPQAPRGAHQPEAPRVTQELHPGRRGVIIKIDQPPKQNNHAKNNLRDKTWSYFLIPSQTKTSHPWIFLHVLENPEEKAFCYHAEVATQSLSFSQEDIFHNHQDT